MIHQLHPTFYHHKILKSIYRKENRIKSYTDIHNIMELRLGLAKSCVLFGAEIEEGLLKTFCKHYLKDITFP